MLPAKNGAFDGSAGESSAISQLLNPSLLPSQAVPAAPATLQGLLFLSAHPSLLLLSTAALQGWEDLTKPLQVRDAVTQHMLL